jgi:hypothetical protein
MYSFCGYTGCEPEQGGCESACGPWQGRRRRRRRKCPQSTRVWTCIRSPPRLPTRAHSSTHSQSLLPVLSSDVAGPSRVRRLAEPGRIVLRPAARRARRGPAPVLRARPGRRARLLPPQPRRPRRRRGRPRPRTSPARVRRRHPGVVDGLARRVRHRRLRGRAAITRGCAMSPACLVACAMLTRAHRARRQLRAHQGKVPRRPAPVPARRRAHHGRRRPRGPDPLLPLLRHLPPPRAPPPAPARPIR